MKSLKVALFGLLIATVGMLAASDASAQTAKHYVFNPSFTNGQLNSAPLAVLANYTITPTPPSCLNPTTKFCEVKISFTGSAPTDQAIVNEIKAKYDSLLPAGFTDGQTWQKTIGGVLVTFTAELRS